MDDAGWPPKSILDTPRRYAGAFAGNSPPGTDRASATWNWARTWRPAGPNKKLRKGHSGQAKPLLAKLAITNINAAQMHFTRPNQAMLGQTHVWPNPC